MTPPADPTETRSTLPASESLDGSLPAGGLPDPDVRLRGDREAGRPGASLTPRYETLRVLGEGGMGRVVLVRDGQLKRVVALKRMLAGSVSPASLLRFLAEAQTTAQLAHPNIVPVYDSGLLPDGDPYVTMKHIEGVTLRHVLLRHRAGPSLPGTNRILRILIDVARALAYAHSRGVVHRDLKPENIMIGAFGETVVMDWGLAKVLDRAEAAGEPGAPATAEMLKTGQGAVLGTLAYLSPEQAQGRVEAIDERTDIWAMGVILFEFIAGRLPFEAASPAETLLAISEARPIEVVDFEKGTPLELAAIATKCLERDRSRRYATAESLRLDLEAFLDGRPLAAARYTLLALARKWVLRHKAVSAVSAVSIAALASLTAFGYVRIQDKRREAEAERDRAVEARREIEVLWAHRETRERALPLLEKSRRCFDLAGFHLRDARAWPEDVAGLVAEGRALALRAAAQAPDLAAARLLLGLFHELDGRVDLAVEEWRRAAEIDPRLGLAHLFLGRAYAAQRELLARESAWDPESPSNPVEAVVLGRLAATELAAALDEQSDLDGDLERRLALALQALVSGPPESARALATESIGALGRRMGVEEFLWLVSATHRGAQRFASLDLGLERHPNQPLLRYERGAARRAQGDPAGAREDLDRAIAFAPGFPHPWVERALLRAAAGDAAGAIEDCSRALEVSPSTWSRRGTIERLRQRFQGG